MAIKPEKASRKQASQPSSDKWSERRLPSPQAADDCRSPYEVDYSRVIHSASFRRLQGKTQILSSNDGDFHRTRMSHSLEVAQVATGILQHLRTSEDREDVKQILPPTKLIETASLIHDLGHSPFGHGGENALDYCLRHDGGFEGNGQTLRILTKLEVFTKRHGSNMTRRTLLAALKYPVPYSQALEGPVEEAVASPTNGQILLRPGHHAPKCYLDTEQDVVDWLFEPFTESDRARIRQGCAKSLDCSIMDLADDMAYGLHDTEDAVQLGLVSEQQLRSSIHEGLWDHFLGHLASKYPAEYQGGAGSRYDQVLAALFSGDPYEMKKVISRLVSYMLANTYIDERPGYDSDMYRYVAALRLEAQTLLAALKRFIFKHVICSPEVQQIRFKGQNMIIQLFSYLDHDPRHLLPEKIFAKYRAAIGGRAKRRVIGDYIASMTDASLTQAYERLFSPRAGSSFDNL